MLLELKNIKLKYKNFNFKIMTKNRIEQFKTVQSEGLSLFTKKNKDYGDAFAKYGTIGVLVRIGDKIMRYQSISKNKIILNDDETLQDTLIDLHNYAAMALILLNENTN